jgi:hypothetical protein
MVARGFRLVRAGGSVGGAQRRRRIHWPGSAVVHRALAVEPSVHSDPGRAAESGVGLRFSGHTPGRGRRPLRWLLSVGPPGGVALVEPRDSCPPGSGTLPWSPSKQRVAELHQRWGATFAVVHPRFAHPRPACPGGHIDRHKGGWVKGNVAQPVVHPGLSYKRSSSPAPKRLASTARLRRDWPTPSSTGPLVDRRADTANGLRD